MRLFRDNDNRGERCARKASKAIRKYERSWAYGLAAALKEARPISVWEVILPVLLIVTYARRSVDRNFLADNLLFTKNLALEVALAIVDGRHTVESAREHVESVTAGLLTTVGGNLYSERIREAQLREMDYLKDHYCLLLQFEGNDHAALIRSAYGSKTGYLEFLDGLAAREEEVNRASLKTLGSRGNRDFVAAMEKHSRRLRSTYADKVFK